MERKEFEPGDRIFHRDFGISVVVEVLEHHLRIDNRGKERLCGKQTCHYFPDTGQILERSKKVRCDWSEAEHKKRAGVRQQPYEIRQVPLGDIPMRKKTVN